MHDTYNTFTRTEQMVENKASLNFVLDEYNFKK